MGTIKDRNVMYLKKQKILRRGGKNTQKNCTKKDLHDSDNHDGVITQLLLLLLLLSRFSRVRLCATP